MSDVLKEIWDLPSVEGSVFESLTLGLDEEHEKSETTPCVKSNSAHPAFAACEKEAVVILQWQSCICVSENLAPFCLTCYSQFGTKKINNKTVRFAHCFDCKTPVVLIRALPLN